MSPGVNMWVMKNVSTGELFYLLRENCKYNIGRQGADLVLRNDSSISRTHAVLQFSATASEEEGLTLEDAGSKYGTFHNDGISTGSKIDKVITLKDGDKIRFGQLQSVWNVSRVPLITMTSALSQKQAHELAQRIAALGGRVLNRWDASCTHLTMDEVTVTVKLLHVLLEQLPIVTCEYWDDLLKAVRSGRKTLPLAESYTPSCCEALMQKHDIDLNIRAERKNVFAGKTFVFMNRKSFEMYGPIVQKAGGAYKDINRGVSKTVLLMENILVIQYIPSAESQSSGTIGNITEYLESHGRRVIPEYEIGLAILHCSTEKYCNPNYKILRDLLRFSPLKEANALPCTVLAGNSSTANFEMDNECTDMIVNETNDDSEEKQASSGMNRAMLNDHNDQMPSLRVTESSQEEIQGKRKHSCDEMAVPAEQDSDDSDTPLFQYMKRPLLEKQVCKPQADNTGRSDKSSPAPKAMQKTLEEKSMSKQSSASKEILTSKSSSELAPKPQPVTIPTQRNVIATGGFLEKSQRYQARTSPDKSPSKKNLNSESGTGKRTRITVITDDDDNDLFSFESTPSTSSQIAKKSRTDEIADGNDTNQDLFGFTGRAKDTVDAATNGVKSKHDPCKNNISFENSSLMVIMPIAKPKPLPQKVSTEGWLSTSVQDFKIKVEKAEKIEEGDALLSDERNWMYSLNGGFKVHTRAIFSISLCKDASVEEPKTSNKIVKETSISKVRNFKTFVKKPNSNHPPKVISTVTVPVVKSRL